MKFFGREFRGMEVMVRFTRMCISYINKEYENHDYFNFLNSGSSFEKGRIFVGIHYQK